MPPQNTTFFNRPFVAAATVLAVALLVSFTFFSWALYSSRVTTDTLSATGSAKQKVTADSAKWTSQIMRSTIEGSIPATYAQVERDIEATRGYVKAAGITDDQITTTPISVNQEYYGNESGPRRYMVMGMITIKSSDVAKVQSLAQGVGSLVSKGVMINPNAPEYYVSNLPDLRVSLLGSAIQDARARADEIAKGGGVSVGALKSASSGVVQVLSPGSIEVSDYGQYDTSSIEKEVMVTVRATFSVK